jgi:hypothetical protein
MNSLRCSNCAFLNFATATACKRCGLPFDSPAGTDWNPQPYASTELQPQPTEGGSFAWDQPSYQSSYPPPAPSSSSVGNKIVLGVVVFVVLGMAAFMALPRILKNRKTEIPNVSWSEYRSPDNKFSISMPVAPKEMVVSRQTPLGNVPVHVLQAEVSKEGGCILMYADYPLGQTKLTEEALFDYTLQAMSNRTNTFSTGSRKFITHDGRKGLEIVVEPTAQNKLEVNTTVRLFWVSPRIYVLLAGGPDTPEYRAIQTRCLDSLKISTGN